MNVNGLQSRRSYYVLAFFVVLWMLLCIVLFNIQIRSYDEYQGIVINQITKETTVTAERGDIYDTNMNLLAGNKTVWLIFISPQDIISAMEENFTVYTMGESSGFGVGDLGLFSARSATIHTRPPTA